jgi:hypothetical protein
LSKLHATGSNIERHNDRLARTSTLLLATAVLVTACVRAWIIGHHAEPDGDAKGHLGIAAALLTDPFSVTRHWVWPPGFHYFLAGLLASGLDAQGVRYLNCVLAGVLPVLVWWYVRSYTQASPSRLERLTPTLAGVLCAVMPVVNLLGSSAQPGTLFAILVLLAVAWIDGERYALAGWALAAAVMVRYEAFGGIALLVALRGIGTSPRIVRRLPDGLARLCRLPLVVVVPPVATVLAWLLAHRVAEGSWLGFVREIYRYTHAQRQTFFHDDAWTDFLFFPVVQPYYLFGLTVPLFLLGLRRAWRPGFLVPLGIYLFLLGSYTFKGVLASGRYYESLTPYLCVAAAHGVVVIGQRWKPAAPLAFLAAFVHVVRLLLQTGRWTFHLAW